MPGINGGGGGGGGGKGGEGGGWEQCPRAQTTRPPPISLIPSSTRFVAQLL